jgi:hypothetical protein
MSSWPARGILVLYGAVHLQNSLSKGIIDLNLMETEISSAIPKYFVFKSQDIAAALKKPRGVDV